MKIVVGLGNPGKDYERTRHNAGFMLADALAKRLGKEFESEKKADSLVIKEKAVWVVKPQTFMNKSGQAINQLANYYHLFEDAPLRDQLYIAHDDLDLALGTAKIRFGKGPKIHNGLLSLYQHLKTDQFWHIRIGVDNRQGDRSIPGHMYVLKTLEPSEQEILETTIDQLVTKILS